MFTRQDKVQLGKRPFKNHNLKIKIPSEAGSKQLPHSTAPRHSKNSMGDLTRLVAMEHIRNKYSLRESIHLKSVTVLIASI